MTTASTEDLPGWAAAIYERLTLAYGQPTWRPYYRPIDELVLTFLSQNTSDLNSGRAFAALEGALSRLAGGARRAHGGAGRDDPFGGPGLPEGAAASRRRCDASRRSAGRSTSTSWPTCPSTRRCAG